MPSADEAKELSQLLNDVRETLEDAELADSTDSSGSAVPIGQVEVLGGDVEVIRADGAKVGLSVGDSLYEGDILETGADGSVGVIFLDGGSFSLGENGRMTLDEMTFDAATQSGEAVLSVVEGVFSYVSGQIAKFAPDAMTIATPSANIGIRGTAFAGSVDENGQLTAALMEENGGFTGELIFTNSAGVQIVNQPGLAVKVTNETTAPSRPFAMSAEEIGHEFARAIHSLPGLATHLPSDVRDAVDEAVNSQHEMTGVDEVFDGSVLSGGLEEELFDGFPDEFHDGPVEPAEFQPFVSARDFNPLGLGMGSPPPVLLIDPVQLSPLELMALRGRVERFIENEVDGGIANNTIDEFDEVIQATPGDDVLHGRDVRTQFVMDQNDSLGGNDTLYGGGGVDEINFKNLDNFELVYQAGSSPPRVYYEGGNTGSIDLNSVEQLYADDGVSSRVRLAFSSGDTGYGYIVAGSAANDTLSTASGATLLSGAHSIVSASVLGSLIFGKGGDDDITGSSSGDILYGGTGNDVINGGDNVNGDPDVLRGDDGADILVINDNAAIAGGGFYGGGQGYDALKLLSADDYDLTTVTIVSIENLIVEGAGSTIQASNLFLNNLDSINASASTTGVTLAAAAEWGSTLNLSGVTLEAGLISILTFKAGDVDSGVTILDSSLDSEGRTLLGGAAGDQLYGFGGADTLIGEGGADVLNGGAGSDIFKYTASSNGGVSVEMADVVMDFTAGEDSFLLEAAGFGSISTLANGYNYTEVAWSGGDLAALNGALADGTIEALMAAAGIGGNIDSIAFLSYTDNSGGEDTAQYLLYDNDVSASDGVTVLADMNATTVADISEADFAIG